MNLDIRVPIGLLFAMLGGLLIWQGLNGDPYVYQDSSLDPSVNLDWGAVLLVFGLAMLAAATLRRRPPES